MANKLGTKRVNGQATAQVEELYMLRYQGNEEAAKVLDTLVDPNSDWYPCLSLKGTVEVGQDDVSIEMIQVDQFDAPIGMTTEPGDFNFTCFMPSFEEEDLKAWLGDDIQKLDESADKVEGFALNLAGNIYTMSLVIKSKIGPYPYMVFSRAQVSVALGQNDKVFGLKVSGRIMAPAHDTNAPVYFIKSLPKQEAATPGTDEGAGA